MLRVKKNSRYIYTAYNININYKHLIDFFIKKSSHISPVQITNGTRRCALPGADRRPFTGNFSHHKLEKRGVLRTERHARDTHRTPKVRIPNRKRRVPWSPHFSDAAVKRPRWK